MLNALRARNNGAADAVEDVIWGNVTQVGEQGGLPRPLRRAPLRPARERPRPLDQPLLRLRPRGGEPRRQPGEGRRRRRLHRRRRRDDEPRAHGLRRRRHRRRPLARASRATSCRRASAPTSSPPSSASPATTATSSPSRARSAPPTAWEDNRFAKSVVPVRDVNGLPILDRDEYMRPGTDMQSPRRAQALVQGHGRDHARLRRRGDPEVPAPRADQPRPPRRQLLRHRRRRRRGADRQPRLRRQRTASSPAPASRPPPRSAPIPRSC